MKNNIVLLIFSVCSLQLANAQNVGIGTTTPLYPLHLQTSGSVSSWGLMHTNGNVYLGSFIYQNGVAEFGTRSNHPLYFFTNNSDAPPAIAIDASGKYVGINTTSPLTHFDIHGSNTQLKITDDASSNSSTISRYTNRLEIGVPDIFQVAMGSTANPSFLINSSGYVGIGNNTPVNKLQIGATPGFSGNDFAIGNGTNAMSFYTSGSSNTWYSNNNFSLMPNGGNGYVGIGTQSPANNLQVGSYINAGFGGNQFALGFGTNVTVLNQYAGYSNFQTSSALNIQSASNIYLMPGNGNGYVGINTNVPFYPLEIEGTPVATYPGNTTIHDVIMYANGVIVFEALYAFSDKRVKNIIGLSSNAKDLETLNKIKITDYTMKDKMKYGDKIYKKVVAQELEEVYPQVVNKINSFIPNTYLKTDKVTKKENGYLLHFNTAHNISKNAKILKVFSQKGETKLEVINVLSDVDVLVKAENLGDSLFVYGEEVNDFRTVDYEGLTTLNISATQELSKIIKQQQTTIDEQHEKIKNLSTKMEVLMNEIESLKKKN